ncbi:MAG: hypothetical protein V4534_03785 [Myxococcota bacterium]
MKYIFIAALCSFQAFCQSQLEVIRAAELADGIYVSGALKHLELETVHSHDNPLFANRLAGFFNQESNTLYVVVRGTSSKLNWISDARIGSSNKIVKKIVNYLTPSKLKPYGKILDSWSQGWFEESFEDLKSASNILIRKHNGATVIFTGHSYGGIMANLLAQDAYHRFPRSKFRCHTFNAPGAAEIRSETLNMPQIAQEELERFIFNHVRESDLIGQWNTHEGKVHYYANNNRWHRDAHAMAHFVKDLRDGAKPLLNEPEYIVE